MTVIRLAAFGFAVSALALPALAEDPPAAPPVPAAPVAPAAPATPAMPAAPAANTGRVYVSYATQAQATYDANLAIDDLWLSDPIKPDTCVYFDLPAGDHKLHTTTTPVWRVTVTAGGSFYTDIRYRRGAINGLVPVDGDAPPANPAACKQGIPPL